MGLSEISNFLQASYLSSKYQNLEIKVHYMIFLETVQKPDCLSGNINS